jgi:hypothetical protein
MGSLMKEGDFPVVDNPPSPVHPDCTCVRAALFCQKLLIHA